MQKFIIQIILLLGLIIGASIISFRQDSNLNIGTILTPPTQTEKLQVGDTIVNVEIADTASKRTKGLGGRDSLASNSGMLFTFPDLVKHRFWMKGMKFPLDFIWIKGNMVVDLLTNIPIPLAGLSDQQLPVYEPITEVDKVLEVNAGFISTHGVKVGDKVELVQSSP